MDRGTYLISSRMAVAAEENSPKKVSNADKENNSPLSHKNARSARKKSLLSISEEGEVTSLASGSVSTDSGWKESSTSPLNRDLRMLKRVALKEDEHFSVLEARGQLGLSEAPEWAHGKEERRRSLDEE